MAQAAAAQAAPSGPDAPRGSGAGGDHGSEASTSYGRFELGVTPALRQLLKNGAADSSLPEDLRQECQRYAGADGVPWRLAQQLCEQSRRPGAPGPAAWLHSTASGPAAALRLRAPAPRARPAALTQRLEKLQGALDDRRYAEMVADVTATERRLAALGGELFPTTRLQLSFGAHVLVMMGTFFALGFYGARFVTGSDTWAAMGGALGMAAALLLETSLLIIRQNMPEPLDKKYGHLMARDGAWRRPAAAPAARGADAGAARDQRAGAGAAARRRGGGEGGGGGAGKAPGAPVAAGSGKKTN